MTPLERAARALFEYEPGPYGGEHLAFHIEQEYGWRSCVDMAKIVLTAIREPSEAMEDAGAFAGDWNRDNLAIGEEAKTVYAAMIDAMLEEG
ncbi:hypothetical protein U5A82_17395 [Sphingobium sp. CR2-8]|uniref:hypothetical protein n=1 Tax=Sphingobium sp. CR2-8 TaxID=1306534 RepID=UPI002DB6D1EB|nr:hypothetical protein [Sphingobium sp. CR2-8]MEC3912184.1 hypothetical protein [Sphingobium sp. CR2-8]